MDCIAWDEPALNVKRETVSDFDAENWPNSSCVKTEVSAVTKVKDEDQSIYPVELQYVAQVEPTLAVVKSEYEVQENYWDPSTNPKIESDAVDFDNDESNDYNNDVIDDDNDVDYDQDDVDDFSDTDDSEKDYNEHIHSGKKKNNAEANRPFNNSRKFCQRRNFFESYIIRLCPFCGTDFDSHKKWKKHTKTKHNFGVKDGTNYTYLDNGKAKCNQCNDLITKRFCNLKTHVLTHLPYTKIFKCKLCTVATATHSLLKRHIELQHIDVVGKKLMPLMKGQTNFKCAYCDKYVGDASVLGKHITSEHAEIYEHKLLYVCPICGEQFETNKQKNIHLENQHELNTLSGLCVEMVEQQQQHGDATQESKMLFRCLKCKLHFDSETAFYILKDHAFTHAPYKRFKCRYCEFVRPRKAGVITHTCNSFLRALKCNPNHELMRNTNKKDVRKKPRQRKLKTDLSDKLYICPSCGESFDDQVSWDNHLTLVHNFDKFEALNIKIESSTDEIIKYFCLICNKPFNTIYRNHVRVHAFYHMPYKMYKCKLCQASLNSMGACSCKKANIKAAFIYVCPKCSMEFSTEKNWRRHIFKVHHLNQPSGLSFSKLDSDDNDCATYKCADCNEVIKESTTMVRNMFVHATVRHMPYKCYKCIDCRELCASDDSMLRHTKTCKMKNGMSEMPEDVVECSIFAKCQCYVCGYLDDSEERVTKHLHEDHNLKNADQLIISWLCTVCEYKCDSEQEIRDHIITTHINVKPTEAASDLLIFHCPACEVEFLTKLEWQSHIFEQHALNTLEGLRLEIIGENCKCLDCGLIFKHVSDRKWLHRMQHLPYKPYKCSKCSVSYLNFNFSIKHALSCDGTMKATSKRKILQTDEDETNQDTETKVTEKTKIKKEIQKKRKKSVNKTIENPTEHLDNDNTTNGSNNEKNGLCHKYWPHISFACPECNMKFLSDNAWHSHITTEHDFFSEEQLFLTFLPDEKHKLARCIECGVNMHGSFFHARRHKLTHMPYPSFACKLCTHRSRSQNVLVSHIQRQHFTVGKFKCVLCDIVFKTSYDRFKHVQAEHADAEWPNNVCHICMKVLKNHHNLSDHLKTHEFNLEIFECGFCERKYYHDSERKKHWSKHHSIDLKLLNKKKKKFVIPQNDNVDKSDSKAEIDLISTEESNQKNKLTITEEETKNQDLVEGTNKLEDNFEDISDLEDINTNSEEMAGCGQYWEHITFACPECNMPFSSRNAWYKHTTMEHDFFSEKKINITPLPGEKRKVSRCNECGVNVYGSPFQSRRHKLTHMPYQSFICKICTHRSRTHNVLIYHIQRRHFTAGEFKCILCPEVLNTSYDRVMHTKAEHTDAEWPDNACKICMSVLKTQASLKLHMKTHDFNRKTFECGFCERKYFHVNERKFHWMQHHPVELATVDGEKKKFLVQKVPKGSNKRKLTLSKKKASQSDKDSDSDTSSDSIVLARFTRNTRGAKTLEVKEEKQAVKNEEIFSIKNEPQSVEDTEFII